MKLFPTTNRTILASLLALLLEMGPVRVKACTVGQWVWGKFRGKYSEGIIEKDLGGGQVSMWWKAAPLNCIDQESGHFGNDRFECAACLKDCFRQYSELFPLDGLEVGTSCAAKAAVQGPNKNGGSWASQSLTPAEDEQVGGLDGELVIVFLACGLGAAACCMFVCVFCNATKAREEGDELAARPRYMNKVGDVADGVVSGARRMSQTVGGVHRFSITQPGSPKADHVVIDLSASPYNSGSKGRGYGNDSEMLNASLSTKTPLSGRFGASQRSLTPPATGRGTMPRQQSGQSGGTQSERMDGSPRAVDGTPRRGRSTKINRQISRSRSANSAVGNSPGQFGGLPSENGTPRFNDTRSNGSRTPNSSRGRSVTPPRSGRR